MSKSVEIEERADNSDPLHNPKCKCGHNLVSHRALPEKSRFGYLMFCTYFSCRCGGFQRFEPEPAD